MLNTQQLSQKPSEELITLLIEKDKLLVEQENTLEQKNKLLLELEQNYNILQERLNLLLANKYKKQAEDSRQLNLPFDEPQVSEEQEQLIVEAEQEITTPSNNRINKKRGRKPIPKSLPRKDIIHDLSDCDKQCSCGREKECIDEEVTEQLEYIPAQTYVNRHIRKKYACENCDENNIALAPLPKQPIPRSIAGPGLLAQILVAKYCYHLPLYRQEEILHDAGIDIPRATTSSWVIKCSKLLQPLVNLPLTVYKLDLRFTIRGIF